MMQHRVIFILIYFYLFIYFHAISILQIKMRRVTNIVGVKVALDCIFMSDERRDAGSRFESFLFVNLIIYFFGFILLILNPDSQGTLLDSN